MSGETMVPASPEPGGLRQRLMQTAEARRRADEVARSRAAAATQTAAPTTPATRPPTTQPSGSRAPVSQPPVVSPAVVSPVAATTVSPAASVAPAAPAAAASPVRPIGPAALVPGGPRPTTVLRGTPIARAWLATRAVRLDARRQPAITGAAAVTGLLRSVPPSIPRAGAVAGRAPALWGLAPAGTPTASSPAPATGPSLRSRSVAARRVAGGRQDARTAQLLAALSAGLDIGEGRTPGHSLRTSYLALRLGAAAGLADFERADLLYAALLKDAGTAGIGSDEPVEETEIRPRPQMFLRAMPGPSAVSHLERSERGTTVVRALGFGDEVALAVAALRQRWDGRGDADGVRGEAVPLHARIIAVAEAAEVRAARSGPGSVDRYLRSRRGSQFDPEIVDLFVGMARLGLWRELEAPALDARLLEMEPGHLVRVSDAAAIDALAETFADIVDTRTPRMGAHGSGVARLAEGSGRALGLPEEALRDLRRAGLLHDVGKLSIPLAYLEKPEALSSRELAVVAAHPRYSYQILSGPPVLRPVAELAACHHDPLDGKGRFTTLGPAVPPVSARVLAICDRFEAMTADRPYRRALPVAEALRLLHEAAQEPLAREALAALEKSRRLDA